MWSVFTRSTDSIPSALFRPIECAVGLGEECIHRSSVIRARGVSGGGRYVHFEVDPRPSLGQYVDDPLRDVMGDLTSGGGRQSGEFVSTDPEGRVGGARVFGEEAGHPYEDDVADVVAEFVADGFELVHVDQDERKMVVVAKRPAHLLLDALLVGPSVQDSSQWIPHRLIAETADVCVGTPDLDRE